MLYERYQTQKASRLENAQLGKLRSGIKIKQDEVRKTKQSSEDLLFKHLCNHRKMQRAYATKPVSVVKEHLTQEAFNKRKLRDKMIYQKVKGRLDI